MDPHDFFKNPGDVRRPQPFDPRTLRPKAPRPDHSVQKMTKVASKRIGGCLRAEQARQQKRRDSKH